MSTTPEQRTLTRGSHWMRVIDASNWIYHFGHVSTEADRFDILLGNLESTVFSRLNRDGWDETVHASDVWPIPPMVYAEVAAVGWDVRSMNRVSAPYRILTAAYSDILQMQFDERHRGRRDLRWFLKEVEDVAWLVAATGYKGFNRINDRRVLLRFAGGAHVQGVDHDLRSRGFRTARVHPSALDVRDRSEA